MRNSPENRSATRIGRRTFLRGAAAISFGALVRPSRADMGATRVAIVGAGMAGLAAARVFMKRRIPFVLLEARDRIGGRAYTDWKSFSAPFDQGCGYLGAPQINPLSPVAAELGFAVLHEIGAPQIWFGTQDQGVRGTKSFESVCAELARAIGTAGAHGDDVPAASLALTRDVWDRLAAYSLCAEHMGVSLNQLSTLDWYSQVYSPAPREGRIRQGIGNFVAAFGAGIPVSLQTPVNRIDWRGTGVRVETNAGTITAECCLLTVPVGVLRSGSIAFTPPLPPEKQSAFGAISSGAMNKVALSFKPGILPADKNTWLYQVRKDTTIADVTVRPFGYDLSIHLSAGDLAREMELLNNADQIALALETITDVFGSDAASGYLSGAVTRWWRDPFARGSHSAAEPGQAHQRAELAKPVAERIHFAGEACATTWASSLPGAYQSGRLAAREIADGLEAVKSLVPDNGSRSEHSLPAHADD